MLNWAGMDLIDADEGDRLSEEAVTLLLGGCAIDVGLADELRTGGGDGTLRSDNELE